MDFDYEGLRADLYIYYDSFSNFPFINLNLSKIIDADYNELIEIAKKNNFDLNNYILIYNNDFKIKL